MKTTKQHHYTAGLAEATAVPNLLCGLCNSILPRARIFRNVGDSQQATECQTIGLCSADDCGAVNCCDQALAQIEDPERHFDIAS